VKLRTKFGSVGWLLTSHRLGLSDYIREKLVSRLRAEEGKS